MEFSFHYIYNVFPAEKFQSLTCKSLTAPKSCPALQPACKVVPGLNLRPRIEYNSEWRYPKCLTVYSAAAMMKIR